MTIRDRFVAAADRLFERFASVAIAATYRRTVPGSYNPTTGATGAGTVTVSVATILDNWKQDQIDGTIVKVGDRIAKIRANQLGFEPSADDEITMQGRRWMVMRYSTDPAGVVYDVHVRAHQ